MSSRTLRFYFKIVYTSNKWNLDIDSNMCTADFVNWINSDDCHRLFNIHEQYHTLASAQIETQTCKLSEFLIYLLDRTLSLKRVIKK